jgi:cyclase
MLKRRIIPIELLSEGRLVKTTKFDAGRDVGDPVKTAKVYSDQDADEILLLDIDRSRNGVNKLIEVVARIAECCFAPLIAGGGIKSIGDAEQLFKAGADKVLINSAAYYNRALLTEISNRYGSQAIVVGIDVRFIDEKYKLFSGCGRRAEIPSLEEQIAAIVSAGAGEILVQRIEYDGAMQGYDLNLLRYATALSKLPVIAAAGAGTFLHIKEAFDVGVDAAACGSLFNFGDNNPIRAKAFLKNYGVSLKSV